MDSSILYKVPSKNTIDFQDVYGNYKIIKKLLNNFDTILTSAIQEGNLDVIDILVDIKATLSTIDMSDKQKHRINLFMQGYTETEISNLLDISRQSVQDSVNSVCKKISKGLTGSATCSV